MAIKRPRPFERSEFSTPHEASQVENQALRDSTYYDIYGDDFLNNLSDKIWDKYYC